MRVVDDLGLPLVGPICTLANILIKILSLDGYLSSTLPDDQVLHSFPKFI